MRLKIKIVIILWSLIAIAFGVTCVAVAVSAPDEAPVQNASGWRMTTQPAVGTLQEEHLNQAHQLARSGDIPAFARFISETPGVVTIPVNTEVFIIETKVFKGMVKIRPRGHTLEYWVDFETIK